METFKNISFLVVFAWSSYMYAQDISLFRQFNGRYDYVAIGNTLNPVENEQGSDCTILTSSSATLDLDEDRTVVSAYLYWAGSGPGDFDILLNGEPVTVDRVFDPIFYDNKTNFSAFSDVTDKILEWGNGSYTVSEFDISDILGPYCLNGTNFGGWAIIIVYEDARLPLNQLNIYDGMQSVPFEITITLDNLNVLDNEGAKIGFLAWEGDAALAVNETLSINGIPIGNPPLNPVNNAFNGTNSFTGSTELYNMDIDVYDIQNHISIGDTSAFIRLTSGRDFVMVNNIVTVLNSQLPDATIDYENHILTCNDRDIELNFVVRNNNATDVLPANTPISFYANEILIGQTATQGPIEIGGSENGSIIMSIPENIPEPFQLTLVVDDDGSGFGMVTEIDESNNYDSVTIEGLFTSLITDISGMVQCNIGFSSAMFNLAEALPDHIAISDILGFYTSMTDLVNNENSITFFEYFSNISNPQTIYVKVQSFPCFEVYRFEVAVRNCPPLIPEGFSPTGDGVNDWFNIQGLYDIFLHHRLYIYNRYGTLIYEGNNTNPWDGRANRGLNNRGILVPTGTYYYILYLNDPDYPTPMKGWVYLNY